MSARLTLVRDGAIHVSRSESVALHETPAYKLVVGIDADVRVRTRRGAASSRVVLVPPNVAQAMGSEGTLVAFFAEPGSMLAGHAPNASEVEHVRGARAEALGRIARSIALGRAEHDADGLEEAFRAAQIARVRVDARAQAALHRVVTDPELDVVSLARTLRLSPERLRHLVRAETGRSLRTHRLWHRTLEGVERLLSGVSIGRAAVDSGFSDHAHFTRSFVRFLGRTPSSIHGETRVLSSYTAR